jgi:hypothetical protein
MVATKDTEEKIAVAHDAASENSGSSLLAMLIVGFVLIIVGIVVVMMFV